MKRVILVAQEISGTALNKALANHQLGAMSILYSTHVDATKAAEIFSAKLKKTQLSHYQSDFLLNSTTNNSVQKVVAMIDETNGPGSTIVITDRTLLRQLAVHYNAEYHSKVDIIVVDDGKPRVISIASSVSAAASVQPQPVGEQNSIVM